MRLEAEALRALRQRSATLALALDRGAARRGGVQQQVDEVVVQQVHLVDVEDSAMGGGEQSGLVGHRAAAEGLLQVEKVSLGLDLLHLVAVVLDVLDPRCRQLLTMLYYEAEPPPFPLDCCDAGGFGNTSSTAC